MPTFTIKHQSANNQSSMTCTVNNNSRIKRRNKCISMHIQLHSSWYIPSWIVRELSVDNWSKIKKNEWTKKNWSCEMQIKKSFKINFVVAQKCKLKINVFKKDVHSKGISVGFIASKSPILPYIISLSLPLFFCCCSTTLHAFMCSASANIHDLIMIGRQ